MAKSRYVFVIMWCTWFLHLQRPFHSLEDKYSLRVFGHILLSNKLCLNDQKDQAVVIDFGELRWRGWRAENTRHETLFGPTTFSGFSEDGRRFAPEPWDRVDVFLKSRVESSTGKSQKSRLGRCTALILSTCNENKSSHDNMLLVCSCLDFQSYITDDRTVVSAKMAERASCNLRLNLGDFLYTSKKIQHQLNFWHEQQQAAKGVLGKLVFHFSPPCACLCLRGCLIMCCSVDGLL